MCFLLYCVLVYATIKNPLTFCSAYVCQLGYDSELEKKLAEQRELRERIRQQKEARRLANAKNRREALERTLAGEKESLFLEWIVVNLVISAQ